MNTSLPPAFRKVRVTPKLTVRLGRLDAVVVLAPHPDDEVLGCGLLIARLAKAGVAVMVIALTDGNASHPGSRRWPPAVLAQLRRAEMRRGLQRLGAGQAALRFIGARDGHLAEDAPKARVAALCRSRRVGLVVAASGHDHHPDHRASFAIGTAVATRLKLPMISYGVWSRVGTLPQRRLHDRHTAAKTWAIGAHRSQISDYIADAPQGFRLSKHDLKQLVSEPECYRRVAAMLPGREGRRVEPK